MFTSSSSLLYQPRLEHAYLSRHCGFAMPQAGACLHAEASTVCSQLSALNASALCMEDDAPALDLQDKRTSAYDCTAQQSWELCTSQAMSDITMLGAITAVRLFHILSSMDSCLCHSIGSLGSAPAMLSCKGHRLLRQAALPEGPRPCTVVTHIDLSSSQCIHGKFSTIPQRAHCPT